MARVAVLYCKRIQDHSCIACAKCYMGMREKNGEFARHVVEVLAIIHRRVATFAEFVLIVEVKIPLYTRESDGSLERGRLRDPFC